MAVLYIHRTVALDKSQGHRTEWEGICGILFYSYFMFGTHDISCSKFPAFFSNAAESSAPGGWAHSNFNLVIIVLK